MSLGQGIAVAGLAIGAAYLTVNGHTEESRYMWIAAVLIMIF